MAWVFRKVAAVCALSAIVGVPAANADPLYIGYSLNGGPITALPTITSSGSAVSVATKGGVHLTLTLTGSPIVSDPTLMSTASAVNMGSGSPKFSLYFSETDLTTQASDLTVGWSNNGLSATVTETAYVQSCVVAGCNTKIGSGGDVFATTDAFASRTVPGQTTADNVTLPFPADIGLGTSYDETLVYTFTLTPKSNSDTMAGTDDLNAGLNLTGFDVPEPLTLSLFGAGLFGVAAARRRKKRA